VLKILSNAILKRRHTRRHLKATLFIFEVAKLRAKKQNKLIEIQIEREKNEVLIFLNSISYVHFLFYEN
jgi:hypothetical protein